MEKSQVRQKFPFHMSKRLLESVVTRRLSGGGLGLKLL